MPLSGRHDDPKLDEIARSVFALFPECMRCGQQIVQFEEADVRVHSNRVVHRRRCPRPGTSDPRAGEQPR